MENSLLRYASKHRNTNIPAPIMITIGTDARLLRSDRLEGIGRVADEWFKRIIPHHPEWQWFFLTNKPLEPRFYYAPTIRTLRPFPPARHTFLDILWFDIYLPFLAHRYRFQLFFSPVGSISLTLSPKIPQIMTIHDLAFLYFPEAYTRERAWYFKTFFPRQAQKAVAILTVSETTKYDIVQHFRIAPEKITVVYNGCSDVFQPVSPEQQAMVRAQFTNGHPYFITVGTIQPRKNLPRLFAAFDLFKQRTRSSVQLLVVGRRGWKIDTTLRAYHQMMYRQDVHFLDYIPDSTLNLLLGSSIALCYVSLYEGFGLPIIEAMKSNTAVICSNTSSLPEVAGDAAILVDPLSPTDIANAMEQVFTNPSLRQQLIAKGQQHVQRFSWEKAAQTVEQIISQYC